MRYLFIGTDFKNVHLTLVKSEFKNSFAQKTIFLCLRQIFCLKLYFLGAPTKVKFSLLKSVPMKRRMF
jgi:hypothetical protein